MSLLTSESREIDGVTFKVGLLNVANGREMQVRLLRTFGPALGELMDGGFARALGSVADRLDTKDFTWLCDTLAARSSVVFPDGRELPLKDAQEETFAGHYDRMLSWIEFCLEVNYPGFFGKLRTGLDTLRQQKKAPSASKSPKASTGTSGE